MRQQTQGHTEILNMESSSSEETATCHGCSLSFGAGEPGQAAQF